MNTSELQVPRLDESATPGDFSSVQLKPEKSLSKWLMILLAAFTAIVLIWVMLIIIYPSMALS